MASPALAASPHWNPARVSQRQTVVRVYDSSSTTSTRGASFLAAQTAFDLSHDTFPERFPVPETIQYRM